MPIKIVSLFVMEFNILDIILGGLILYGAGRGFFKGFIIEITALAALILGTYGALHFSYFIASILVDYISWEEKNINSLAFVLTFILIIIGVTWIGKLFTKLAKAVLLGFVNRALGSAFGALKMVVISGVLIILMDRANALFNFIPENQLKESILYQPLKSTGQFVFGKVTEQSNSFKKQWL